MAKQPVSLPFAPADQAGPYHIQLHSTEGGADKVYEIIIAPAGDGFLVNCANGRRGSALTAQPKTPGGPVPYEDAKAIATKALVEKVKKGYNPLNAPGASLSASSFVRPEDTGIRPQLLKHVPPEQNHENMVGAQYAQEKHNGHRRLLKVENGVVRGINKTGMTASLPAELVTMIESLKIPNMLIDGELIGDRYVAFDFLSYKHLDLRDEPLRERIGTLEILASIIARHYEERPHLQPLFRADLGVSGEANVIALAKEVQARGGEGIVIKNPHGKYRTDRNDDQIAIKFWNSLSAVVSGHNGGKRSVSLSLKDENGGALNVGNVTIPANFGMPAIGDVAEVRYMHAYEGGSLYMPVYLGPRDDVAPEECTADQRVFKPEDPVSLPMPG